MGVTVSGVEVFASTLADAAAELADLSEVSRTVGAEVLAAARIPVRTGTLARSAYVDATPDGFALSATAPYAGFVHAVNPFFTRAVEASEDRVLDAVTDHAAATLDTIRGA